MEDIKASLHSRELRKKVFRKREKGRQNVCLWKEKQRKKVLEVINVSIEE